MLSDNTLPGKIFTITATVAGHCTRVNRSNGGLSLTAAHMFPSKSRGRTRGRVARQVTESGSFNFSVAQYDLYNAYLLVCHQGELYGGGEVTSTFINLDPEGRLTQHLSIQLSMLPSLYMVGQSIFRLDLLLSGHVVCVLRRGRRRAALTSCGPY